jgi:hypothetical protein
MKRLTIAVLAACAGLAVLGLAAQAGQLTPYVVHALDVMGPAGAIVLSITAGMIGGMYAIYVGLRARKKKL